jgi:hypothetical protein
MPNRREFDHIGNYNFKVEIEGVTVAAFQEVGGLEVTTEVVEFQDGDDITTRKRPGRTNYSNLVLKRGYTASDELWEWMSKTIDGTVERKSGSRGRASGRDSHSTAWAPTLRSKNSNSRSRGSSADSEAYAARRLDRLPQGCRGDEVPRSAYSSPLG